MASDITLRPDAKGRISLGKFMPPGTTGFRVTQDKNMRIILEPCVEIPAREMWLWNNPEALAAVQEGLRQSAAGETAVYLGDFSQYIDDDEE